MVAFIMKSLIDPHKVGRQYGRCGYCLRRSWGVFKSKCSLNMLAFPDVHGACSEFLADHKDDRFLQEEYLLPKRDPRRQGPDARVNKT